MKKHRTRFTGFDDKIQESGVNRARLEADNTTNEPIDFRSLRDMARPHRHLDKIIERRMGHASRRRPTAT